MSPFLISLFRLIHIVAGVFWVGGVVTVAAFILPSVGAAGPAGGAVMQQLMQVRRLPFYLTLSMAFTVLAGAVLLWHDMQAPGWAASGTGIVFSTGATLGLVAGIIGLTVNKPTADRLSRLAAASQGGTPDPATLAEMQRLRARLAWAAKLVAVLVLLATAAMAVARYVF
ncbi:MAG: hypothetical protein AB7Q69_02045 [Gemmatimonadales bacterium]